MRSYKVENILKREFDNHQDMHSACWYIVISTSSVFGFMLDIVCLSFTASIIFYYMLFDNNVSGANIGLAITQAMSLTGKFHFKCFFPYQFFFFKYLIFFISIALAVVGVVLLYRDR